MRRESEALLPRIPPPLLTPLWLVAGIDYPICGQTSFSRVNHLGNAMDDANIDASNYAADSGTTYLPESNNANRFVWTIPTIPTAKNGDANYFAAGMEESYKSCTLRLRYNISTSDFPQVRARESRSETTS